MRGPPHGPGADALRPGPGPLIPGRLSESLRIHAWLRTAILDVTLLPGAAMAEAEIAERFGTSRTPVREALLRLADESLVEIRPQRGTYVSRLALHRIEEALFVREAIETAVLRRAVARPDHRELGQALADIAGMQETAIGSGDVRTGMSADALFHHALVDASGLPGVWEVVARARDMHHRIRAIAVPELGSARTAIADHRAIAAAVRSGNPADTEAAMATHLGRNLALARAIAQRHPDYFA